MKSFFFLISLMMTTLSYGYLDYPVFPSTHNRAAAISVCSKIQESYYKRRCISSTKNGKYTKAAVQACSQIKTTKDDGDEIDDCIQYIKDRAFSAIGAKSCGNIKDADDLGDCLDDIEGSSFDSDQVLACSKIKSSSSAESCITDARQFLISPKLKKSYHWQRSYSNLKCYLKNPYKIRRSDPLNLKVVKDSFCKKDFETMVMLTTSSKLQVICVTNPAVIGGSQHLVKDKYCSSKKREFILKETPRGIGCYLKAYNHKNEVYLSPTLSSNQSLPPHHCHGQELPDAIKLKECEEKLEELKAIQSNRMYHYDRKFKRWLKDFQKITTRTHRGFFKKRLISCQEKINEIEVLISSISPEASNLNRSWGRMMGDIIRSGPSTAPSSGSKVNKE